MATKKTFEQSMKQLERIVRELEAGDLPLEKAIQKFEEGIQLSKQCTDMLDKTEQKISILLKDQSGNTFEKPFSSDEAPSEEE